MGSTEALEVRLISDCSVLSLETSMAAMGLLQGCENWAVGKELKLSYHSKEILFFTLHTYTNILIYIYACMHGNCGNFI